MADSYNFPTFERAPQGYEHVDIQPALRVGMEAPDFDLPEVDGARVRLHEVASERHVVLMFGSITSARAANHLPVVNRMWEYFRWRPVQFLMVYAREAHPGERHPHHTSFEQKLVAAREFQRVESIRFPVLVDSLDGEVHRQYGPAPHSCFVVNRDFRLVFRAQSVDPSVLREYLEHLLLWDAARERQLLTHPVYTELLRFQLPDGPAHDRVFERAGPKAAIDSAIAHGEPQP